MVDMLTIQQFADRIAAEFQPERIILFGSYAYGTATPDSDVDLLVILRFEGKGAYKAAEIMNKLRPRFAIDLLVRTPDQMRQRLAWNDFFLLDITEKGKVLYESTDS
jgi:predicted nucleotidyltransferase